MTRTPVPVFCLALLALVGCPKADDPPGPPLGMILEDDGITYAGAAVVDMTPEILETFTDLNDDGEFNGCLDMPAGGTEQCEEPFDDVNGNGWFDCVFMGGYGPMRPALDVHDPITARAVVLSHDGEYLAFVALDLVGLLSVRIDPAREALAAEGFDGERLIVASTHNHQGPDTMGLWGNPYDMADPVSGLDLDYQQRVTEAIEQVVRDAAADMQPVTTSVGSVQMRDRSPFFSGAKFGGKNPTAKMHGMVNDIRDPVIVSDQLLVMQGLGDDGQAVFTYTNWSGHPEVWGDNNNSLSSDWIGVTRTILEEQYGGVAIHMPECLGGMQSAGGGDLPLVDEDGTHQHQVCDAEAIANPEDVDCYGQQEGDPRIDADGDPVPVWAEDETWEFTVSNGWHIAEAAMDVLASAQAFDATPMRVETETLYIAVENIAYQLMGNSGVFDMSTEDAIEDPALCPEASQPDVGCIPGTTHRVQLGPIEFFAVPGELFPELARGLPTDQSAWQTEAADPAARGADSTYFVQHDPDCNDVDWLDCKEDDAIGECDCLSVHAWPYEIAYDATLPPLLDLSTAPYKAVLGMANSYWSYIVPEPDFNTWVSLLRDDGDHYEDTVAPGSTFGTRILEAQTVIDGRW